MRVVGFMLLGLILPFSAAADFGQAMSFKLVASILKVHAVNRNGSATSGSAVMIAPGTLVTNCHVTRGAQHIEVIRGSGKWLVESQVRDIDHDLCILSAPGVVATVATIDKTGDLQVGQSVFAVGYPAGGELTLSEGKVKALHSYDGAKVIQGSASFTYGASGGGLFDRDGHLVGVLTFKARAGGSFHFAVPVAWLDTVAAQGKQSGRESGEAFWQRRSEGQPYFLRSASLEANEEWKMLAALAQEWMQSDPVNPEPWIATGKALHHLKRGQDAASAFQTAVRLDPSHAEAWHQLNLVYQNSGEAVHGHNVAPPPLHSLAQGMTGTMQIK